MEAIRGGTENSTEFFTRNTRRAKNNNNNNHIINKSINSKLNVSKDQENVKNTSLAQVEAETSMKDEVAKSETTLENKVHGNSSTPRRRKDPLANLHSNLSPKYIGFTTPPNQLNNSKEEKTRSLRRRYNNSSNIADTSIDKDKEADIASSTTTFTPNNDSTVGFVRRTPRNRDAPSTPESNTKRKEFISPIHKLLIKNGAVMENDYNLPKEDEEFVNSENFNYNDKVLKDEAEQMDLGVRELENCDEKMENGENASTTLRKIEHSEGKGNDENCSLSSKINYQIEDDNDKNEEDDKQDYNNDLNPEANESRSYRHDLNTEDENSEDEKNSEGENYENENSKDENSEEDELESQSEKDNIDLMMEGISYCKDVEVKSDNEEEESSCNESAAISAKEEDDSYCKDDKAMPAKEEKSSDCYDVEAKSDKEDDSTYCKDDEDMSDKEGTADLISKGKINDTEKEDPDEATLSLKNDLQDKIETSKSVSPVIESDLKSSNNDNQKKKPLIKVDLESAENESNNEFAVDASAPANSPSAVSMDSAKGSSIIIEGSWMSFTTGDLYWGQIYNYCYWPCMVCPDPKGKTVTSDDVSRSVDQSVLVHVRFFADNGRRNWVKRENLLPFTGIENYEERIVEVREKYGSKSAKYRLYVPIKRKEQVWYEAVNEANIVAEIPYKDRLEKFYELFEKSKAFHKLEKQRRKSMYISVHSGTGSDIESLYSSNDNINSLSLTAAMKQKRERSISPYSPAYSPIKSLAAKKRKLSTDQKLAEKPSTAGVVVKTEEPSTNTDLNVSHSNSMASTSSNTNSLKDLEIFNSLEFRKFYAVMKDFVLEHHNEKLEKSLVVAVRNIWALKQLGSRQMERKFQQSTTDNDISPTLAVANNRPTGEGSVKRLSSRLKTLMVRKSLMAQQAHDITPERSVTPKPVKDALSIEKIKKPLLNRPILEVIDDIFELDTKYLFKGMSRDPVCKYCFQPGGNLRRCAKNCTHYLHNDCLYKDFSQGGKRRALKILTAAKPNSDSLNGSNSSSVVSLNEIGTLSHVTGDSDAPVAEVICKECAKNEPIKCMVCNSPQSNKDEDPLVKCNMAQCERAFHPGCCKYWPQAKITISKNHIETFRCPSHVCHTCVSDDPKGKFQHLSNAKLTKCVKCPASFHTDSTCIPAGSQILTAAHIVCPRHSSTKHDMTVNVNWCFICVEGGQVICCETCPTAVHAHCLKIPIDANEGYICEECESGRMPLYGEMVWAKFNNFRWWPAIILPPTEIPKNIARKTHNASDFVVRFFGTHDHGWISRRRVYLYLEGDSSEPPKTKSSLDLSYNKGVEEAKEVYQIIKAKKLQQQNSIENKEKLHPQPYVRIRANRSVPPVKLHVDIESVNKCECDAREENPCGPDTNCLNRVLYHECNSKLCPAGDRCQNQMFESRISPRLDVVYMKERGFGLVCREPIKAGTFIIEYVGEIINDDEFQARMQQKSQDRDENFYFLSVEKDYIIDAGPKGNLARFMNHSCDPNCETQKWSVNSLNRIGLFSIKDIPENTELTFNYHWDDLLGNEKKTCYCGAVNCAGQIGGKIKDLENVKEPPVVIGNGKNKSKTKNKSIKRLLNNGAVKNKMGPKLKRNGKTKMKTKKVAAAVAVTALLEAKSTTTSITSSKSVPVELEAKVKEEASTSRILNSPDIFS